MFEAMERGELRTLYVVGENPAQSEADADHANHLLEGLDHLVVQDIFLTRTAEMADVVLPASASWCEAEGTVTNSERRVQRVRKALDPPGQARDDIEIVCEIAARLGHDWGHPTAEQVWDELRSLSPMHAGMSYSRLEQLGGIQWPCLDEQDPGQQFLHGRLWADPVTGPRGAVQRGRAGAAGGRAVRRVPDPADHRPPARLLQHRRPDRRLHARRFGAASRSTCRRRTARRWAWPTASACGSASRRGSVVAPVRLDPTLRAGLAFMTLHFPDEVETNVLTIEATDPKSGTAEFKAAAIRVEKLPSRDAAGADGGGSGGPMNMADSV